MAYELYMGNILCPVTPSKIQMKIKNQNKTMNLVNGTEVNILKDAGLTEISYDLLLPNVNYRFAKYKSKFVNAKYFLDEFEKLKVEKKPFIFKLLRTFPNGVALYDTNDVLVSLESYTIKEDAKQGFDVMVSITLKQFKPYGTKIVKVLNSDGTASVEEVRETSNSPAPSDNPVTTHTVVEGDCLWNIAKMYYGDGSKYPLISEANKDKLANSSLIPGMVLIIPGATQKSNGKTSAGNSTNSTKKQYCKVKLTHIGLIMNIGTWKVTGTYKGLNFSEVSTNSSRTFNPDSLNLNSYTPGGHLNSYKPNGYLNSYNSYNSYNPYKLNEHELTYDLDDVVRTFDVDYGSTLVFEFTPLTNESVFFIPDTSERRVTWEKTRLSNDVLRCEAKIYNNVVVKASWQSRGDAVSFK